jgi:hypothetical protein
MAALGPKSPGTQELAAIQHLWTQGGALSTKVLRLDEDHFDYDVTHCAYAEMYKELGLGELGFVLSCGRDAAFIEGYAPHLVLTREKTIMTGDEKCEFRYRRVPKGSS